MHYLSLPHHVSPMKLPLLSLAALSFASLSAAPALADTVTTPINLGTLGGTSSIAYDVSEDGAVVTGWSQNASGNDHAFRWTQASGMTDLGTLGGNISWGISTSFDGSVVVGKAYLPDNITFRAFRWTQSSGMVDLGTLGGTKSYSPAVSGDGSTIVGYSYITGDIAYHAFRWTQASGMTDLGTLGGTNSWAGRASFNGSIVMGSSQIAGNSAWHAYRWTQETGMKDLNALLADAGVNMTGITLKEVDDFSSNGRYIVGQGDFPGAAQRGFLVCYDPNNGCIGLTTGEAQADSAQTLADDRRATMIRSRATANELLGMTRPMSENAYVTAGGLFGCRTSTSCAGFTARTSPIPFWA